MKYIPRVSLPGCEVLHPPPSQKTEGIFFAHSDCIHTLNTLSLQAAQRAEFSTTPKVLACEPSDLRVLQEAPYIRCLLITWRPSQGPRDGPGCAWDLSASPSLTRDLLSEISQLMSIKFSSLQNGHKYY